MYHFLQIADVHSGQPLFATNAGFFGRSPTELIEGDMAQGGQIVGTVAPADFAGVLTFDGVRVPSAHLLGAEGDGFAIAMQGLDGGRINIATCSVGAAQGALAYVHERRQFGRPLADFQALQFKLADMATELVAARQMVRLAASCLDAGTPDATLHCAMAKRLATDLGFSICNEALQIHGGYGYIREYPLERYLRDARVHQILEGTNEIMRVIIARRMLADNSMEKLQ